MVSTFPKCGNLGSFLPDETFIDLTSKSIHGVMIISFQAKTLPSVSIFVGDLDLSDFFHMIRSTDQFTCLLCFSQKNVWSTQCIFSCVLLVVMLRFSVLLLPCVWTCKKTWKLTGRQDVELTRIKQIGLIKVAGWTFLSKWFFYLQIWTKVF